MQRLKISREGVILIKSFEGFRPRAVRRDDGQWVIGYGHTASAREGASVSEADAELLLQYDLIPVAKALNDGVSARVNQHQFDALASFAFSVGLDRFQSSDVLSRLNAGFAAEAADALVGWPEPVLPEASLRRRAAERALFVADPAWPVALSDLLVAPLPPPAVAAPEPVAEAPQAVAPLLSDPAPILHQPETPGAAHAMPNEGVPLIAEDTGVATVAVEDASAAATDEAATVSEIAAETTAPFAPLAAAFTYPSAQTRQRYSAYPGVIVGPLPAPMLAASPAPSTGPEAFEPVPQAAPEFVEADASPAPAPAPAPAASEPSGSLAAVEPFPPLVPETFASPFASAPGPEITETEVLLPRFGAASDAHAVPAPDLPAPTFPAPDFPAPAFPAPAFPAPASPGSNWPAITAVSEPRADGELLVLTSPNEDDFFASPRPVWPHDDQGSGDAIPLFEDDGSLRLAPGNIIRHEPLEDVAPASIPWGELGAYGLMGAFGLVSFGMSMAAFRRASQAASDADGTTVIAVVLAVIGAACVGVSAYNLYRRWGRADEA